MTSSNVTRPRPHDGYVKSSLSDGGANCVLVRRRANDPSVFIRDSKYQRNVVADADEEPIIEMPSSVWDSFVDAVLSASNTLPVKGEPEIVHLAGGGVLLRGIDGTTLVFTVMEWKAFRAGLRIGEFELEFTAA